MKIPFIGGIAINDKCNLKCLYCSVSNRNIPDMTFDEVNEGLMQLYKKGIRNLYIEGGEPFLWKDDSKSLDDLILSAKKIGFKFISIYTNGTQPVKTIANTVFVSLDGVGEINDKIRGKSYDKISGNIKSSTHKKIIINCTISRLNKDYIEDFCQEIRCIKNIKGIFFYFYTSVNGNDDLYISKSEKQKIIKNIINLKKKGYKILNSKAGLMSTFSEAWERPNKLSYLYAENKLYQCCRFVDQPEICKNCGYLGFSEIYLLNRLNINAVYTAFKYV